MKQTFVIILVFILSISTYSQLKELSLEDAVLGRYKGLHPKGLKNLKWVKNTPYYCFISEKGIEIKSNTKNIRTITLDELKNSELKLDYIPYIEYIDDNTLVFKYNNSIVYYNYIKKEYNSVIYNEKAENIDTYYNSKETAYTIDNNLYVIQNNKEERVTKNNDINIVSGKAIHRFEFGIEKGTFWSPKGKKLAFYEKDETNVANYPLLDISTTPGSLKSIKYPMAGQKTEYGKVQIYDLTEKKSIYLNTGEPLDRYFTNITWGPEEKYIYIAEVLREQNHMFLTKYDATTGKKIKTLFEEKNNKWVEPENGLYFLPNKSNEFLWLSERNGFMNIYHYDTEGKLISKLTNVKWVIDNILGFDTKGNNVVFKGTGEDPREIHAFKVNLKTKKIIKITKEPGTHEVKFNSKYNLLIDNYSNLSTPRVIKIININNNKETKLFTANNPLSEYKYGTTELITLKSKNKDNLYGRIIKPSNFDSNKKYPVLVYVYGGPHAQLVTNKWLGGANMWMYWMAEKDYIIFTLDGRGSKHRGFEFESAIHRQLGTLEIEDQIEGVEYLKTLPFVDNNRMAVHGWSFGGFMTTSLMLRTPGVFTTGVAGGPVIDWKWYEIMYGERYMDEPSQNKEGYEKASLLNYIDSLEGNLLMIHGTIDDIVVMQHSLAFVKECVKKGKQIDFFPYPMHPHNVRGKDRVHLMTKVLKYILEKNK